MQISGIMLVFFMACAAWMVLGVTMIERSSNQSQKLRGSVVELWGRPQRQQAPTFTLKWTETRTVERTEQSNGVSKVVREQVEEEHSKRLSTASTALTADLALDQRLKGLMWYSLYDLRFNGAWTYTHADRPGSLELRFLFPDPEGLYDGFRFVVDGVDRARELQPRDGAVWLELPVDRGQQVRLEIGYRTRGMDEWRYVPAEGVANLENFQLAMTTDFEAIDFPSATLSPSAKAKAGEGWKLEWTFQQLVTGQAMGIATPQPIQPGELAADLSFSAPVSLLFFFLLIFVLATLKGIDLHPINYLLIAGAFFAFHLLFAYLADHLEVVPAFALSSLVSVFLVVSYLRLVVSSRFAFVEAGLAQLLYLVIFSLAHFWDGFTGLTITVLSILTLFLLMQLTGRIRWSDPLSSVARIDGTIPAKS